MIVKWSAQAEQRFIEILSFLENNLSLRAAQKFHLSLWNALMKIQKYPTTGKPSARINGVRSMKIDRYRRVFYLLDEPADTIIILDVFDNRQDPKKLKY